MQLWIKVDNQTMRVDSRSFEPAEPKVNKHGYWNAGKIQTPLGHIHIADIEDWSGSGYFDHCEEVNQSIEALRS